MKRVAQLIILLMGVASVCDAQESPSEPRCDFSTYAPLLQSHIMALSHPRYAYAEKIAPPKYPAIAKGSGIQGPVKVNILVDPKGNVVRACAAEGHPLLRAAAVKAALGWKFRRF
ncbi:MAG: energy transducer TonB, partial [Acidobacteriota bacterium]|nr:energy transducer TonB [Acidobacteriota bacterium]